jgi:hypothetical protein
VTLEKELERLPKEVSVATKVAEYNRANREVAILCNHQKTVNASTEKSLKGLSDKVGLIKVQLEELKQAQAGLKAAAGSKGSKKAAEGQLRLKRDSEELEQLAQQRGKEAVAAAAAAAAAAGSSSAKADKPLTEEEATALQLKKLKEEEAHLFSHEPSLEELAKQISVSAGRGGAGRVGGGEWGSLWLVSSAPRAGLSPCCAPPSLSLLCSLSLLVFAEMGGEGGQAGVLLPPEG